MAETNGSKTKISKDTGISIGIVILLCAGLMGGTLAYARMEHRVDNLVEGQNRINRHLGLNGSAASHPPELILADTEGG